MTGPIKAGIPLPIMGSKVLLNIPIASPKEEKTKPEESFQPNNKEEFKEILKQKAKFPSHIENMKQLIQSETESDFGSTLKDSQTMQNKLKELGTQSARYEKDQKSNDY